MEWVVMVSCARNVIVRGFHIDTGKLEGISLEGPCGRRKWWEGEGRAQEGLVSDFEIGNFVLLL